MNPRFSIITVTRNNREGLRRTLASIRRQTFTDYEVIVINGNSTDGSEHVIEEFADVVTITEKDAGRGIYPAMNQGVALAGGDWVIFMNSGDQFFNEHVLDLFSAPAGSEITFGKSWRSGGVPHIEFKGWGDWWKDMPFSHQSTFFRTEIMRNRPFVIRFKIVADYDFLLWACVNKRFFHQMQLDVAVIEPGGVSQINVIRRVWESYRAAITYYPESRVHRYYLRQLMRAIVSWIIRHMPLRSYLGRTRRIIQGAFDSAIRRS
jgi:glycosyltransferase involved in cell wall biosynthesis